jgi:surfeit locus 1 family protein
LPTWLPLVIGALLVVQFAGLGAWQVSRGLEKRADRALFTAESSFTAWQHGAEVRAYQRLKATGHYAGDRQVLLENILVNGQNGYYVVTPLVAEQGEPPLLINRGWIKKGAAPPDGSALAVPTTRVTVRGRAGSLPRAGYKMGTAIPTSDDWPRFAVYPSLDEVAAALGTEVQPFVLLMDHQERHGFLRNWKPAEFGPGKHFGYALQWFAMAAVLSALLIWNYRKKRFTS